MPVIAKYKPLEYTIEINKKFFNKELTEENTYTLFHEFLHYYQDIGTYWGQYIMTCRNNIIARFAMSKNKRIKKDIYNITSIKKSKYEYELMLLFNTPSSIEEDLLQQKPVKIKIDKHKAAQVKDHQEEFFFLSEDHPAAPYAEYYIITINDIDIPFDGFIISECMAAMYESVISNKAFIYRDKVPYDIPRYVAQSLNQKHRFTELEIGLLCEMSLNFQNPGYMFVKLVNEMKQYDYRGILKFKDEYIYENMLEKNQASSFAETIESNYKLYKRALKQICTNKEFQDYADYFMRLSEPIVRDIKTDIVPIFKYVLDVLNLTFNEKQKSLAKLFYKYNTILIFTDYKVHRKDTIKLIKNKNFDSTEIEAKWLLWTYYNKMWIYSTYTIDKTCPFCDYCQFIDDITSTEKCRNHPLEYHPKSENCIFRTMLHIFKGKR